MERGREVGSLGTPGLFFPVLGSNWDRKLGVRTPELVLPSGGRVSGLGTGEELCTSLHPEQREENQSRNVSAPHS